LGVGRGGSGQWAAVLGPARRGAPNQPDGFPAAAPSGAFQVQKFSMEKGHSDRQLIPQRKSRKGSARHWPSPSDLGAWGFREKEAASGCSSSSFPQARGEARVSPGITMLIEKPSGRRTLVNSISRWLGSWSNVRSLQPLAHQPFLPISAECAGRMTSTDLAQGKQT